VQKQNVPASFQEGSMRRRSTNARIFAGLLAITLIAAACGGGDDEPGDGTGDATGAGGEELTGTIVISGSSTVEPISSIAAEVFNETSPNVSISVDGPGTGDGFELFCKGETDISDASRQIEKEEADACAENGINYTELEIGIDGIVVMTNQDYGDVTCLNTGDLYALFGPESTGIDTWAGADDLARQVGGNGGFPDLPLEITAPGEESGTYDSFIEILGFEDIAIEQGVPEDEAASLRSDYQASPNDNVIITAMEGSPSALGFVGFAFAEEAGDAIKEIEVDGGDGCVAPTVESIGDGSYPISRSLYIYVNDESAKRPEVAAFVDHYLSDDSLNGLVAEVGYIPLPAERIDATRSAWESATA
jgi:phosphate transport system substrate-binding protein